MNGKKALFFIGLFLSVWCASAQDNSHLSKKEIRKLKKDEKVKEG